MFSLYHLPDKEWLVFIVGALIIWERVLLLKIKKYSLLWKTIADYSQNVPGVVSRCISHQGYDWNIIKFNRIFFISKEEVMPACDLCGLFAGQAILARNDPTSTRHSCFCINWAIGRYSPFELVSLKGFPVGFKLRLFALDRGLWQPLYSQTEMTPNHPTHFAYPRAEKAIVAHRPR